MKINLYLPANTRDKPAFINQSHPSDYHSNPPLWQIPFMYIPWFSLSLSLISILSLSRPFAVNLIRSTSLPFCAFQTPRALHYSRLCPFVWNALLINASHRHPTLGVNRHFVSMDFPKPLIIVFTNHLYVYLIVYLYAKFVHRKYTSMMVVLVLNTNHWWHLFLVYICMRITMYIIYQPQKQIKNHIDNSFILK